MVDDDAPRTINQLLGPDAPSNGGKWGPDDEVGSLNYLGVAEALRGIGTIRSGEVFDPLAAACAADRRWEFCHVAAPFKIVGATGPAVTRS